MVKFSIINIIWNYFNLVQILLLYKNDTFSAYQFYTHALNIIFLFHDANGPHQKSLNYFLVRHYLVSLCKYVNNNNYYY